LRPDAAQWIEAEVASGAFPTVEDVDEYASSELRLRDHLDNSDRSTKSADVARVVYMSSACREKIARVIHGARNFSALFRRSR
jgi:hypothetical protein